VLVVLDNCEHQLRAVAVLRPRSCAVLTWVLATSREGLGSPATDLAAVADAARVIELDKVSECDAVRLFVDAPMPRVRVRAHETNAGAVGEICVRLDGFLVTSSRQPASRR
jgi:hypothetical protein